MAAPDEESIQPARSEWCDGKPVGSGQFFPHRDMSPLIMRYEEPGSVTAPFPALPPSIDLARESDHVEPTSLAPGRRRPYPVRPRLCPPPPPSSLLPPRPPTPPLPVQP